MRFIDKQKQSRWGRVFLRRIPGFAMVAGSVRAVLPAAGLWQREGEAIRRDSAQPGTPATLPLRRKRASQRTSRVLRRVSALGVSAGVFGLVISLALAAIIVPALTGASGYTILTRSMEPGLPPGSYVVVRETPVEELEIGNIITFQLVSGKPEVVTHRIHEVEITSSGERRFITRGDANAATDAGNVQEVQIKGEVWYVIPFLGFVGLFAAGSGKGWITGLAVTALFAYAILNVVSWVRDRRGRSSGAPVAGAAHQ